MRYTHERGDFVQHMIKTIRENNLDPFNFKRFDKSPLWERIYEEFRSSKKDNDEQ
jgi:hypothetical protein